MPKCFVIQPFDGGRFDKLYADVLKPAIEDAGLEPYRVDGDPRASELFEKILEGIERCDVCLAEVSTDNANVWFELGYAFAFHRAEVAIVADQARVANPPFDVKNLRIVPYTNDSPRDFNELRASTTERLKAILKNKREQEDLPQSSSHSGELGELSQLGELGEHEVAALGVVADYVDEPDEGIRPRDFQQKMSQRGFRGVDGTLALASLREKGMLERIEREDQDEYSYSLFRLTPTSTRWLSAMRALSKEDDDIPF